MALPFFVSAGAAAQKILAGSFHFLFHCYYIVPTYTLDSPNIVLVALLLLCSDE